MMINRYTIALMAAVLAAFSCEARAQNTFPTPGGGTVPGVVLMCDNGSGQFIPCKVTISPPEKPPVTPPITPTSIGLSDMAVELPPQNAHSFFATVTVTATGGAYTGTLTLGGADAGKFTLSNGGVYPCNLHIGAANIGVGTYHISIMAP
jgi:hypothetical protein